MSLGRAWKAGDFRLIQHLHQAYASGEVGVSTVIESFISEIQKKRSLNAFLSERSEPARAKARELDQLLSSSSWSNIRQKLPLFGVPLAIKDNLHVAGEVTTCGSKMLQNYRAPSDATVVRLLQDAGAVLIGKTNLDEFSMGGSGENSSFGPTLHPFLEGRVPGGSSSGSACAVAAQMAMGALGSDTGGSIRLPASYCGIVGLKPTYGRVSRNGLVAFGSSLDQVGPMARSVADLSAIYDVIHGHDPRDATSARLSREQVAAETQASSQDWKSGDRPVRLGVPQEFFVEGVDAPVRRAVESALEHFRSVGCELVPISLPHLVHAIPVYYVIAMAEASSNLSRFDGVRYGTRSDEAAQAQTLHEFYAQARALFGREVKRRILLGSFILSAGYHEAYYRKACQVRRLIANDFQHAFERVDLIVGPVSPTTAFELGSHSRSPLEMYLNDLFTVPANLAGLPALSLPLGSDSRGMPIGLQCIAPAFQERRLLGWAARAEAELASRAVTGSSK